MLEGFPNEPVDAKFDNNQPIDAPDFNIRQSITNKNFKKQEQIDAD